jgi:hypothetical protein
MILRKRRDLTYIAASPATGQTALNRILSFASSAARPFVACSIMK